MVYSVVTVISNIGALDVKGLVPLIVHIRSVTRILASVLTVTVQKLVTCVTSYVLPTVSMVFVIKMVLA